MPAAGRVLVRNRWGFASIPSLNGFTEATRWFFFCVITATPCVVRVALEETAPALASSIRPEEAAGTLGVIELSDFQLRHDIMFLFPKNSNFRADYTTIFQELRACAQPDGACACPEA